LYVVILFASIFNSCSRKLQYRESDFPSHIMQALHFEEFVSSAPLKHSITYPIWHILTLIFIKAVKLIFPDDAYAIPYAVSFFTAIIIISINYIGSYIL
jgi:hypothetical protein